MFLFHRIILSHQPLTTAEVFLSSGAYKAPGNLVNRADPGLTLKISESVELGLSPELVHLTSSLGK